MGGEGTNMHILLSLLCSFCDTYFPKIKMQARCFLPIILDLRQENQKLEVSLGYILSPLSPKKGGGEEKENPNQINKQLFPLKNKIKAKKSGNRRGEKDNLSKQRSSKHGLCAVNSTGSTGTEQTPVQAGWVEMPGSFVAFNFSIASYFCLFACLFFFLFVFSVNK